MAKAMISSSFTIFLLAFCLLIFSISVQARTTPFREVVEGLELECNKVYGVKDGDTCFALEQKFKITTDHFNFINPNLNCTDLFIGQWLCLSAVLILP